MLLDVKLPIFSSWKSHAEPVSLPIAMELGQDVAGVGLICSACSMQHSIQRKIWRMSVSSVNSPRQPNIAAVGEGILMRGKDSRRVKKGDSHLFQLTFFNPPTSGNC